MMQMQMQMQIYQRSKTRSIGGPEVIAEPQSPVGATGRRNPLCMSQAAPNEENERARGREDERVRDDYF